MRTVSRVVQSSAKLGALVGLLAAGLAILLFLSVILGQSSPLWKQRSNLPGSGWKRRNSP